MIQLFNILMPLWLSSCSIRTELEELPKKLGQKISEDKSNSTEKEDLSQTSQEISQETSSTSPPPESTEASSENITEVSKEASSETVETPSEEPIQKTKVDYLFPSGEIDCKTSCSNFMTRRGGYPDFVESHFDNLGNQALNECYQSAITQGKSVTDLNCKEKALSGCIKFCEGSKPMEWRTRLRSDLQ